MLPRLFCFHSAMLALSLAVLPAAALEAPRTLDREQNVRKLVQEELAKLRPESTDTLEEYSGRVRQKVIDLLGRAKEADKKAVEGMLPAAMAGKTTTVTSPEGFPERVREGIADFLPLLGLSMDAVSTSDDRKSVTLKTPSYDFEYGAVNLTATATEPDVFKPLADKIVEDAKEKEKKALLAKVEDLDDVTFALAFGYARESEGWSRSRHLYGRNPGLYQQLIDALLESAWSAVQPETIALSAQSGLLHERFLTPLRIALSAKLRAEAKAAGREEPKADEIPHPAKMTFAALREFTGTGKVSFSEDELITAFLDDAVLLGELDAALKRHNFDALPSLIDNQPQIVVTLAQRASNEILGPESTTLTARYEMGSRNVNAMLREYHRLRGDNRTEDDSRAEDKARLDAYDSVLKERRPSYRTETKLVISASYKWVDAYRFDHPYNQAPVDPDTGEPKEPPIQRSASVTLPKSEQFRGSLTWTRFLLMGSDPANKTGVELPRITVSLERFYLRDDPERQNRTIAKLSYVQPANQGVSIPITLTWASRPEFLKDQDRTFGAHLGISYKLGTKK